MKYRCERMGPGVRDQTRRRINRYWAAFFPEIPADWSSVVVSHTSVLEGYHGLYAILWDGRAYVSSPPEMAATVRTWGVDAATVTDPAWWRHRVPEGTVLGPSVHAFLDTADTVPRSQRARRADAGEVVHALKGRVTAEEWVESGFDSDDVHKTWLVRDNDAEPVAAAGLTLFDGDPVDVGVIVAADARGRGHGKHAAAAAVHDAIDLHGIVRWRSLEANQPSRQLAKSFSFQDDCRQLAIRL